MNNRWNLPNIPHKEWTLENVIDIKEDNQGIDDIKYETCMMCNKERIRFIHILKHKKIEEEFRVGCICAEKMTNDTVTPKKLETKLKLRASRLVNWHKKIRKVTKNQNWTLKFQWYRLLIFRDKETDKFKCKIGEKWWKKLFDSLEQAKIWTFNWIEYLKEKGKW